MLIAPLPSDEAERLHALKRLDVLDSPPEPQFDALVAAAALVCGVPISLISLVDSDRQWFKANTGLPGVTETPRDLAFCAHTIHDHAILEVPDALADARFADNPMVAQEDGVRFYAGATLRLSDGAHVGTLCVIDRRPRKLSAAQHEILRNLAQAAAAALEGRRALRAEKELKQAAEQAAAEQRASEERYRQLYTATPAMLHAIDAQGRLTYVSQQWLDTLGYAREEALGRPSMEFLCEASRHKAQLALKVFFAEGRFDNLALNMICKDGTLIDVLLSAVLERDGAGKPLRGIAYLRDVTASLRNERALHAERQRLASIIEGTGAGTWEWNVQTGETRFNERWAEIVGATLNELSPTSIQTWSDLCHPEDLARSGELLNAHFAGERTEYECEARMRHRDGHWVWVLDRGRVLTRTDDGQPEWMFGTHLDISARKAQEERLRKSEDLLNATGALAQVGGWEVDIATAHVSWSAQTCRIHGVEPGYRPQLEEAINFYAPEARPVIQAAVEKAMAGGPGWDLELPFIPRGGQRIWVRAIGQVEFENGQPVRLKGAFQDITALVQARQVRELTQERLALATESGGIGVWERNLQTGVLTWDDRMYALFGLPPGSGTDGQTHWARLVHPDDRDATDDQMALATHSGIDARYEFRVVWEDGSVHHIKASARVALDAEGRAERLVGMNWDISPLRALAEELAEQHELLHVTLNSIGDAVITTDTESRVTWLNPVAERLTGWMSAEAMGRPLSQVFNIVNEETRLPAENPVGTCLAQEKTVGLAQQTVLISRNGDEYGVEDSAAPIRRPNGDLLGVVLVFHDVTEQRRLSGEMSYRATHDLLTGLVNRTEFETRLRRTLERTHEDRSEHALLYIDLDQFKLVNDACGHSIGDQLLQQVAKLLREAVRSRDTLARLGGDEFGVILEHCTSDQAGRVAQQICDRMEEFRFLHDGRRFRIGTSIGLVPVDKRWTNVAAAMQAADTSCYAAKEAGRNRVHTWFDTDLAMRVRHGEMQWATRLEQALDEDRFVLYAQRVQAQGAGAAGLHAEVLIRMLDTDGSMVLPGAFLPAAERFHLATRIDRWVLKRTLQHIEAVPELAALDTVCINLSGQSVGDRAFHRHAIEVLAAAGPDICRRICLEITETAAVTNMADATVFIEQVRALGVRVALDDFGAGASSFGYLKNLKVDLLKIDGSFIRDVMDDPLDDAAVRCFVDVARLVGVKTVAEFVDRPAVLRRVGEIGIDYAQGFLLHRPEPIESVLGIHGLHAHI